MLNHVPDKDFEIRRRLIRTLEIPPATSSSLWIRTDVGKTEARIFAELAEFEEKVVSAMLQSLVAEGVVEDSVNGWRLRRKEIGLPQSPTK